MGDCRVEIFHLEAEVVDLVRLIEAGGGLLKHFDVAAAAGIEIEAENLAAAQELNCVPRPSTSS